MPSTSLLPPVCLALAQFCHAVSVPLRPVVVPRAPPPHCAAPPPAPPPAASSSAAPLPVLDQPEAAALQALALRADAGEVLSVDEWHRLVGAAAAAQRWPLAVKTLERMAEQRQPTADAFHYAMAACARAGEWAQALELLRRLRDDHDLAAESRHYEAAVRTCRAGGEVARCVPLLDAARAAGVHLDKFAYAQAIDACEEAGDADGAARLYASGVESGAFSHWRDDAPFALDLHGFSAGAAVCAVRHALRHEVGNFLQHDLKIITGRGRNSPGATPLLLPRVETLLRDELGLRYDFEYEQVCDEERRDCSVRVNKGCLVVALPTLLEWLMKEKPFEQYAISLPNDAEAIEPEEVRRRREEDFC